MAAAVLPCCFLCSSCGRGGATLTTGYVDGIWMPEGSTVNMDLGSVSAGTSTGSNPPVPSTGPVGGLASLEVQSSNRGTLSMSGVARSCSVDFTQSGESFALHVQADDGSISLSLPGGIVSPSNPDEASSEWVMETRGSSGNVRSNGRARLLRTLPFDA